MHLNLFLLSHAHYRPKCTFESLFILCFQHWFFSKWHIFQFVSVWSQMWISSTHIMLIGKSRSRCQKWGTIIIVTFYVFVKYSILGIISSSRWIICFFNFLGFSKCKVCTAQDSNHRLGPNSSKIPEKFSVGGLWPVCGSQVVNRKRYVKTDFRTEKRNRLLFVGAIDFNTLPPKNARNRSNRFSKTEKIKLVAKMIFCS